MECFSCQQSAKGTALPIREHIYEDGWWRVAHAFNSALPGWLVILPQRHIVAMSELTAAEAAALGSLLQRLSAALQHVVACTKTYVMQFAEAAGFQHVHIHLVPRMPELPLERKGPAIFWYLDRPADEWVQAVEMDRIGTAIAAFLRDDVPAPAERPNNSHV